MDVRQLPGMAGWPRWHRVAAERRNLALGLGAARWDGVRCPQPAATCSYTTLPCAACMGSYRCGPGRPPTPPGEVIWERCKCRRLGAGGPDLPWWVPVIFGAQCALVGHRTWGIELILVNMQHGPSPGGWGMCRGSLGGATNSGPGDVAPHMAGGGGRQDLGSLSLRFADAQKASSSFSPGMEEKSTCWG